MNTFTVWRFIRYMLLSGHKRGHGIHSPFIFDVVSKVFRNKIDPRVVFTIERIRKKLIAHQGVLEVNDLGAGSERIKTRSRKVSDIVRYSSVPEKYGILLANMSEAFGGRMILEFGTSLGISTMYLASTVPGVPVITMEGCSLTADLATRSFKEAGLENIRVMTGSFDDLLPQVESEGNKPGLVFIDGDHRKDSVLRYFDKVAGMSDSKTVVIIDDINLSRGMAEAWDEIRKDHRVTATIDIFRMGIVFFREGINRYDYVVRY
ncbi:MAG: SAM-dependent methyltransferase [Bacteroidales bacterium]|jgi:predicted O-methyltransferase YrrM|nr:SAM-dependent methyltransferase [Bacteroidales bacterium]